MQTQGFGLGFRFRPQGEAPGSAAFARQCVEAVLRPLSPEDLQGLSVYSGTDAVTQPALPVFIVVIMGGSLKQMRRLWKKVAAAACALCEYLPIIENNRLALLDGLSPERLADTI
ncbi:MAG: hypothetical protein LBN26_10270 [Christensenellaceae bacterium]|jgi:hypothetical protein|nr:hypothetical protein [Christensenellaceae bacterium]